MNKIKKFIGSNNLLRIIEIGSTLITSALVIVDRWAANERNREELEEMFNEWAETKTGYITSENEDTEDES